MRRVRQLSTCLPHGLEASLYSEVGERVGEVGVVGVGADIPAGVEVVVAVVDVMDVLYATVEVVVDVVELLGEMGCCGGSPGPYAVALMNGHVEGARRPPYIISYPRSHDSGNHSTIAHCNHIFTLSAIRNDPFHR